MASEDRRRPRADLPLRGYRRSACCRRRRCRGSRAWTTSRAARSTPIYWPQEPVELAGKKVAVIGTGATGHPGDRRDRRQGRRAHRVPAPAELERAAQQRPDLRRGDGRHPRALRRDLRRLRPHARRLRARARSPRLLRGHARGAAGAVGQALRRAGLRHLAQPISARSSWTRRPMPSSPNTSPTESAGA